MCRNGSTRALPGPRGTDRQMHATARECADDLARQWARACHAQLGEADREMLRLEALISQAAHTLLDSFQAIERRWRAIPVEGLGAVDEDVNRAVSALQFHDLATQLLGHARKRIAVANEGLARLALEPGRIVPQPWEAPPGPGGPVGRANLEAGTVELF